MFVTLPAATNSAITELVAKMAANEVAARKQNVHYTFISEERSPRTGGHLWRERVVETEDGPLHRLLAIDGRPLSPAESKAEADRINALVNNPAAFRRLNAAHRNDEGRVVELLELLPKALIFKPDGEESGCTRFSFQPNPSFEPSSYEERLVHAMGGTVSLRLPAARLCSLHTAFLTPVEFGYGLLGRVDQGGYFDLRRVQVEGPNWKSESIRVDIQGKVLMLKSLNREQEIRRSDIHVLGERLTLKQAAALSES